MMFLSGCKLARVSSANRLAISTILFGSALFIPFFMVGSFQAMVRCSSFMFNVLIEDDGMKNSLLS